MKKISIFFLLYLVLVIVAAASPVFAQMGEESAGSLSGMELFLELVILLFVGGILYNLWNTITAFGGLIGKALKLVGIGIFLFSFDAVHKVLVHFGVDIFEIVFSPSGAEVFHDVVVVVGLFFLAWGLSKMAKIAKS